MISRFGALYQFSAVGRYRVSSARRTIAASNILAIEFFFSKKHVKISYTSWVDVAINRISRRDHIFVDDAGLT